MSPEDNESLEAVHNKKLVLIAYHGEFVHYSVVCSTTTKKKSGGVYGVAEKKNEYINYLLE